MEVPLGTEEDLGPGHNVLDRDPASTPPDAKGAQQTASFWCISVGEGDDAMCLIT